MCRALPRSAVKRVSVNLTQSEERWEHACEALCVEVAVEKEETRELDSDMSDLQWRDCSPSGQAVAT